MLEFERADFPNKYIGCKSNCRVIDGKMYGSRGLYEGSSRDKTFKTLIKSGLPYKLHILGTFESYEEALVSERNIHIRYDVVASIEFFNKGIATISNYADPNYATYKHKNIDKIVRLSRNHPQVLDGTWVGVTKGRKPPPEENKRRGMIGENNPFFGKKHSEDVLKIIRKKSSAYMKGRLKTNEQRKKMSESAKALWESRRRNKASREEGSI